MIDNEGLKREIGIWGLTSNAINITIGAGIFVLPAVVAEQLGTASAIAYLVCGVLVAMVMFCFADIGSKITITGGAYAYIELAFGKYAGFITTNLFVIGYALMANAAVSNALLDTLAYFFPFFSNPTVRIFSLITLFSSLALVNVLGIRQGIGLVKFNTVAKLIPLVIICLFGWTKVSASNLAWESWPSISNIGDVSLVLFFAFAGIETALNVSGEIKRPARTVPRGILLSVVSILVIYILIQITTQGILGPELLTYKNAPLTEAANRLAGPMGAAIIMAGASFSMFGNLSGETLNMPRVVYAAARDNVIPPKALAKVHSKFLTPHVAIIAYAASGCLLSIIGEFKQLATLSSASILLIYLGVALSVLKFRKHKSEEKTFTIPGGFVVPVAAVLIIVWLVSHLSSNELTGSLIFIAAISLVYLFTNYLKK